MYRLLLLLITATFTFGCMGTVNALTDLDLDVQFAEDAVHPADFPVSAPVGAEKVMSMGMTVDEESTNLPEGVNIDFKEFKRVRIDLISYTTPDPGSNLATAVTEVEAAGYERVPSDEGQVAAFRKGDMTFVIVSTIVTSDEGETPTINLIRLKPAPAPVAE